MTTRKVSQMFQEILKGENRQTTQEVLSLTDVSFEQFCEIEAVSEKQKSFGLDMRIKALANAWNTANPAAKDVRFASALVKACMSHKEAKWWCDNESHFLTGMGTLRLLNPDIMKFY
jgi:hypothetical protein